MGVTGSPCASVSPRGACTSVLLGAARRPCLPAPGGSALGGLTRARLYLPVPWPPPPQQVVGTQNARLGHRCGEVSSPGAVFSEPLVTVHSFLTRPRRSHRNLRKGPSGLADEISFEDFLTIMAYFRPIDIAMDEEQVQLCRKEKLRCACPSPFCRGRAGGSVGSAASRRGGGGCQPLGGRSPPPRLRRVPGVSLSCGVARGGGLVNTPAQLEVPGGRRACG